MIINPGEEPTILIPLSDDSFVQPETGMRFWFEEIHGEMIVFLGEFKSMIAGSRLEPEHLTATPELEQWLGTYIAVNTGNHVSLLTHATVGIDENGFAYARSYTLHGLSPITPLGYMGDHNFSGIQFGMDGNQAWLEVAGVRMVRIS